MINIGSATINETVYKEVRIEIKLCLNQRLYQKGLITEEMYTKVRDIILKGKSKS